MTQTYVTMMQVRTRNPVTPLGGGSEMLGGMYVAAHAKLMETT